MDKHQSSDNLIKLIYAAREDAGLCSELVKQVCLFYDEVKHQELSQADLKFLHFLANEVGIPQYYYMLDSFQKDFSDREYDVDLDKFQFFVKESTLYTSKDTYLHVYQRQIFRRFKHDKLNRFFLSASTSFGKTHLVYEVLRKMAYGNVLLIFPTIALLSENLMRIFLQKEYRWIKDAYSIHTLSDVDTLEGHNLFIFTPERYLSFLDKNTLPPTYFNFVFVDEAYKLDNEYLEEEERKENERDVAYRIALDYVLANPQIDCLFAGPYIAFDYQQRPSYNPSFDLFLKTYGIELINYNDIEIVQKNEYGAKKPVTLSIGDNATIEAEEKSKPKRFAKIIGQLIRNKENVIAYNSQRGWVERYAKYLIESGEIDEIDTTPFQNLYDHLCRLFAGGQGAEWVVTRALRYGIGVHHGLVPKYIQNEIISLFNRRIINVLVCTTTITEGINTNAKNVIVLSGKKGNHPLKKFDAKNIEGRAGRFMNHYTGRVFIMDPEFDDVLAGEDEFIKHKFFDVSVDKDDVDLVYVQDDYLTKKDRERKEQMEVEAQTANLSDAIRLSNKTISLSDKVKLQRIIHSLSESEVTRIKNFIRNINFGNFFEEGFDIICNKIYPIVANATLKDYIETKMDGGICLLTKYVHHFFDDGLIGSINYYVSVKNKNIDEAVRTSTQFVYNTLKYQVVKYLGLFNLIYKEFICMKEGKAFDNVAGLDGILVKFEYNADTLLGRQVSDLGAALKVVKYFDNIGDKEASERVLQAMDAYELENKADIEQLIKERS